MNTHDTTRDDGENLWFLNTWVTIRRPSAAGADGVSIIEHHLPYGDSPPMHMHRHEDEIFHLIEGEMRFRLGDADVTARAGQTVVAPRGIAHSYRVESPAGARCLTMTTGIGFESLVRGASRPAAARALPEPMTPTPQLIDELARIAGLNGIELVGPPLA
jgi:quercetin dioxygenase-like cupin family protein